MNSLLKFAVPGALGLLIAAPAMAQSNQSGNPGWQGTFQGGYNNYHDGNWRPPVSWNNGNQAYNNSNANQSNNNQSAVSQGMEAVTPGLVAEVQRSLQQRGFYNQGNIDGVWGPVTSNAIGNFQQQNNLRATGQLDLQTLDALNLNDNNSYGNANNNTTYRQNTYGQNAYDQQNTYGMNNSGSGMNDQYRRNYGTNYSSNYYHPSWNTPNGSNNTSFGTGSNSGR